MTPVPPADTNPMPTRSREVAVGQVRVRDLTLGDLIRTLDPKIDAVRVPGAQVYSVRGTQNSQPGLGARTYTAAVRTVPHGDKMEIATGRAPRGAWLRVVAVLVPTPDVDAVDDPITAALVTHPVIRSLVTLLDPDRFRVLVTVADTVPVVAEQDRVSVWIHDPVHLLEAQAPDSGPDPVDQRLAAEAAFADLDRAALDRITARWPDHPQVATGVSTLLVNAVR